MATKKQTYATPSSFEEQMAALDRKLSAGYRIRQSEPAEPNMGGPEPEPSRGLLRGAADLGLEAASGAAKGIKFMSDVFGADNPVSQGLQGVSDFAKELQSAQAKGEDQRIAQLMKEAEDKGIGEQVKAALRAAGEAPVRQAIGAIGTSVPMIAASMVPGLREASWGTRAAALGGMGGAQGVGVVKSSMYDAVYQRAIEEGRGEQEARALAQQAQAYSPENAGDIALGGALGVGAALTGFEPAAARAVGGAAAKTAATKAAQRGLMQSTLRGTLAEMIPEGTQGFQEQVAGNRAEQRAGFDTPTFRGAAGSATLEGLLSAPGGAVGGMLDARGAKPAPKLLADQIRATESVPETGPMTRAANQAVEAKAQQVEMTAGAEGAALAAMEKQAQDDLKGLRDFAGRSSDVVAGMPVAGAQPAVPGAEPSAEIIDSPFLDRIQTVQEMLADPATREKVRARWGDEGLNNIAYYAGMANRTGLPEKTQDNLLGMAERLLSESVLTPIQPAPELGGMRRDPLTLGNQPQPATPALGMDGTPSGRFTVDPQGNVAPESRVQAMEAQRRAEEVASLGKQTPRGQAQPETTMQGTLGIGMDTAPTGRLLAGQDGVRPETRMDAINIGQADMQRQAEAAQRAEMGLTPDIEAVQQRNAMRPQDGDILNPSGKPFKTLMAAQRAAKKSPGEIVEVTGGFAIRPATMVAAQPEVANDGRGNQAAAGLAEALAGSNPEAGDRATAGASAVAPGEMLDALPGQPAGAQPAQGNAGQGQRVGREGYDTPVELDAASLKAIIEKTRGEPLATKPAKLEAWRNGTAKTDPAKYPIELAFTTDGRLDVNDGRHRIALAAERGEKVTAFIDGKDAQRAQELLANVQNLPQPGSAQAPADQAPEAARGDGAAPARVPEQGGAAAAVEAAGVEQQLQPPNAVPANEPQQASTIPSRADLAARAPLPKGDPEQAAREQAEMDGINALAGVAPTNVAATTDETASAKQALRDATQQVERVNAEWSKLYRDGQAYFTGDGPTRKLVDGAPQDIAERFSAYKRDKKAAQKAYEDAAARLAGLTPQSQPKAPEPVAANPAAAQEAQTKKARQPNGSDTEKAKALFAKPVPESNQTSAITADDVAAAEKQAAQMISDRIDGMKAVDVQRIAARYLPTVGVKVPVGKARIKAAMTDAAAMNLLGPAGELGIELSDSIKRALTAKMEGRVGEAAAPVAAKTEQQKPQAEQQRTEYPFGRVANGEEDRFSQSRVRVLPDMKGDTAWEGEVGSVLNGGRLLEVKRDGQDFRVRIPGDRIEVLELKDSKSTETLAVTPIDRFEELRANGTDPDPLQNGLAALRKVAGRSGESTADFASRYIGEMGSQKIGTASGKEVLAWMEGTLIRKAWDDQSIPGANVKSISRQATAAYWRDQLDRYERDAKSFNDFLAKMDQRTFDVESMDGSAERIAQAREAIQEMNRKADQNKRELDAGLKAAEAREQAEKDQEEAESNAKFKPADLKDLEKKPTPASITGWSNAVYQGDPAWTNGHLVDLASEPHLSGWQDRMNALRKDAPPLDAGRVVPKSQGTPLKLVGIYDNGNSTAPVSTVYLESNGRLTALNRNYYRYFASKFKGAEFQSHGETQPVTVHLDGRMVGLLMPINLGRDGIKLEEVKAKIAANLKREQESAKDAAAAEFDAQAQQPAIAPEVAPPETAGTFPYTSQQIASAYAQAESAIRGKTWSSNADSTHKGRIRLRLKDMGMNEQDAQALLDRAATIQASEMAGMKGAMMFLRLKDLQRAAIDRGLVAGPSADPAPQPVAQEQPAAPKIRRRDPTKVNLANPYEVGDTVTISGQDWTVGNDTSGWYLTTTGNWRGAHPTIRNIQAMTDLIREVERAAITIPEGYRPAGEFYYEGKLIQSYGPFIPGERVTMKDAAGQSGVVENLMDPDANGITQRAEVKFDNGTILAVPFSQLTAEPTVAAQPKPATQRPTKEETRADMEAGLRAGTVSVEDFMKATGLTDEDTGPIGNGLREQADRIAQERSPYHQAVQEVRDALSKMMTFALDAASSTPQQRKSKEERIAKINRDRDTLEMIARKYEHPFDNNYVSKLSPILKSRFKKKFDEIQTGFRARDAFREDSYNAWAELLIEAANKKAGVKPATKATEDKPAGKVENFGEQLPPARRAMAAKLSEELADDVIASQPLSKIWPIEENEAIEDTFAAAVAHVMREAIPAKPRKGYKLNGWVEKVKMLREFAARILRGGITKEAFLDQMGKYSTLRDMQSKVKLLEQIDRADWRRIGEVAERPNALRFENGNSVPSPSVSIAIDGKPHWLRNSGDLNDHMEAIKSMLQSDAPETRMKFEIRQERGGKVFINKAGDKQFHRLLEFDTVAEARKAMDERYADLVSAWDEVKSRENITERDLRTAENRPRTGKDHRNGRDITAEEFQQQFGFRGGEFGKWVSQGKGAQERQFMLNSAYDALMDLADIVGVPPKAISLNGTLGIAFGSRGGGWASAHFEPSNLVINLTKPRGAGALAHEWFHALDNYFARQRNDGKETMPSTFGPGAQDAYRRSNYITHKTGALMVRKDGKGSPVTKARLEEWRKTNPSSGYLDPDQWMLDPKHPQGVRVEVEERFNALVNALDNSPMLQRSRSLEGTRGDSDGYWSRPLERAARAFENYVQHRMHEQGYHNDFLVNVKPAEDTGKNPNRYPYLMPSEMAPIVEAFNDLFGTVETRETEKGVALFASSSTPAAAGRGIPLQLAKDVTDKVLDGLGLRGLIAPNVFRNTTEAGISDPASIMPTGGTSAGKIYVFSDNVVDAAEVFKVVFHELFHLGLSQSKLPKGYVQTMLAFLKDPVVRQLANDWKASKDGRSRLGKMPLNNWHALAVEEALAIIGEELNTDKNGIGSKAMTGWVKRTIAWMAGLADKWGLSSVARRLRAMTYTEAEAFVQETMLKGRTGAPVYLPDTRFAQGHDGQNVTFRGSARAYVAPALDKLNETFNHPGKLSWWHKTVGSMYNLAERMPAFKPVYDAAQNFINDVSFYAIEAADKAPKLLPRLEDWKDLAKSPITAQDNKAVAAPVFEGTLSWRRDESGKPVLVEDLAKRYASLTPEQKAQRLLRANAISENVLKMWQGMPKDQYESSVNTAFEGRMLKAGIVFTPDELKSIFKLNDAQVALYQEFRQSIDTSLDNMGKSDLLRVAGKDVADLNDAVMEAPDVDAAAVLLRDHLLELAKEDPDRSDALVTTANDMITRAEKVQRLKMEGYAPLSRFGQYTVDVVVDGERQYFSMFETARDANRMAAKLKMEYGAENVAQGTLSQREFEMLQGITPESLELFGNMLGLDSTGNEAQDQVFQEYLKRTKANRSAMKRLIHRKGIAGYSEDVGRVLAAFVYSNARQTSAALHMGDLGEAVMAIPKGEGELKDAAVELARYVKEPREEAAKMRGWLFAQYLGGSIASAIVNFTQPLTTSAPYLSQFGGMGKSVKALYQAMADLKDKKFEAGLAESFRKRTEDGTLAPQGVHELMAQSRGEATLHTGDGTQVGDALAKGRNAVAKAMIGWGKLFGMAEQINRQSTYVAAYRMAVERGMADPDAFAKKAVDETQFVNNKANKMKFGRGAIGATLMTFKSYSLNWLELFHRLATQNGREGKMAAAWMLGVLLLSAGASGLPFAEDAEDLADFLAQRLGYNWSSKKARQEFLESLFGRDIAGFVENGVTGLPGAPIDVSGRLGMGNMIPGTGLFLSKKDHTSDFTEVLGPAGDLAKRAFQAGDLLLSGNVGQAALMIAPKAIGNLEKGVDMAATGMYRDARGYKVDDATTGEAIGKAIGFQPRAVAQIQEASGLNQRAKDFYRLKVERINAKWAKAIFEKDAATVDEVRAEIKEWNRQNPDQRIKANIPAILRRVKEMRKTKAERIADTAPKALRASMREEVRRMQEERGR